MFYSTRRIIIITALVIAPALTVLSQPSPGQNSSGSGVAGGPIGGTAPVGSAVTLLIVLSVAYGIKKMSKPEPEK